MLELIGSFGMKILPALQVFRSGVSVGGPTSSAHVAQHLPGIASPPLGTEIAGSTPRESALETAENPMKPTIWKHGLGALLICIGVGACDQQTTGREEAQAPMTEPEATTTAPVDTGTPQTDPYATTPPADESESLTGRTDISGTQTTGDTLGDRCAGFTGEALTECLEMESARRKDVQEPTLQDPTQTPPQDVPQQ